VSTDPSNAAAEFWPDTFGAEALDLVPLDPTARPRAYDLYPLLVVLRPTKPFSTAGLMPPLEVIVAAPSGRHERTELVEVPIALVVTPSEGGVHRITVREIAHNRWHGTTEISADGEAAR
jgi:hypothetical protein